VLAVVWLVGPTVSVLALIPGAGSRGDSLQKAQALYLNVIALFVFFRALSQLDIDIAPLPAGAKVVGPAIAFGAQKLVQDITGEFFQLENAIKEGGGVGVAGITGAAAKATIRSARLQTLDGATHIMPFSSVDTMTMPTDDLGFHVSDIGVACKEKVPDVKDVMEASFERMRAGEPEGDLPEPLEMHGVISLGDSSVVIRARIMTRPDKQWGLDAVIANCCNMS